MPGKQASTRKIRTIALEKSDDRILVQEAKRRGMTVSALIVRTCIEAIKDAKQMNLFFEDPDIRKVFSEALAKPGAMKKIFAAMSQGEAPDLSQQTIDDILADNTKR